MSSHHKDKAGSTASLQNKLQSDSPEALQNEPGQVVEEPQVELLSYDELRKRLVETEEKAAQSWESLLRVKADMDNMQRRVERDVANAHKYALEKFVMELLPIVDGLERAVDAHQEDASGSGTLLDGVTMTLNMIQAAFRKFGVEQVNPTSEAFNPELHQAVSTKEDSTAKPNTVLTVLQKGYLLNNRLIRPALVVVTK